MILSASADLGCTGMSIDCILAFCVALSSEETASNFFRPFCAHQRNAARSGKLRL